MKKYGILTLVVILHLSVTQKSEAQVIDLLGGNTLNGAITGTILGAATMGLNNDDDFAPLRIGVGLGTIVGAGIGVYDIVTLPKGQQFFISGMFNDGNNTSIILLLDTFYVASAGSILGTAVMLVGNEPVVDGLRYGAGIGAYAGLGVGIFDAFVFADRNRDFVSSRLLKRQALIDFDYGNTNIQFARPDLFQYRNISGETLSISTEPVVEVISFNVRF